MIDKVIKEQFEVAFLELHFGFIEDVDFFGFLPFLDGIKPVIEIVFKIGPLEIRVGIFHFTVEVTHKGHTGKDAVLTDFVLVWIKFGLF